MAAFQGLLYVGALMATWGFFMAVQVYWEVTGHLANSWFYTIAAILLPAQGLLNALIYFYSPMNAVQRQIDASSRWSRNRTFFDTLQQSLLSFRPRLFTRSSDGDGNENPAVVWETWGDGGRPKISSSASSGSKVHPVELGQLDQAQDGCDILIVEGGGQYRF
jgi:hypothetical protein